MTEYQSDFSERRSFLQKRANKYKKYAESEVVLLKGSVGRIGKISMISGMAILGGYFLYKMFFSGKSEEETKEVSSNVIVQRIEENGNSIFSRIKEQIALFLFAIARQKLMDYLENYKSESEKK